MSPNPQFTVGVCHGFGLSLRTILNILRLKFKINTIIIRYHSFVSLNNLVILHIILLCLHRKYFSPIVQS